MKASPARLAANSRLRGQPVIFKLTWPPAQQIRINGEAKNATTNRVTPGRGSGAAGRPALATLTLPP